MACSLQVESVIACTVVPCYQTNVYQVQAVNLLVGARWRKWPIVTAIHMLPWICYSYKPSIQVITKKKSPL